MESTTQVIRKKIEQERKQISELEATANELDKVEIGELIAVERDTPRPAYIGNYEGVVASGVGFHIKLGNFAYVKKHFVTDKFGLCKGEELVEEHKSLAAKFGHDGTEKAGDLAYPMIFSGTSIAKGEDAVDKILRKYGFSISEYRGLLSIPHMILSQN